MNGGRGAKGSINDRLISMMYKNRYKKYQLKKEAYAKSAKRKERDYLKSIKNFDIDDGTLQLEAEDRDLVLDALTGVPLVESSPSTAISELQDAASLSNLTSYGTVTTIGDLKSLNKKIIEVDPATEAFDFENFDYYTIIQQKSKVAGVDEDDIIDVKQEITKVEDEITIVEELEKFIDDSKKLIDEIQIEITSLRKDVSEQYTEEQMKDIQERYKKIKAKVDKLKAQYEAISEKYDFEDFNLLENITMMAAIDEYRDIATLDELETLVEYCKEEIEQIDGIVVEQKNMVYANEEIDTKDEEIKQREEDFKSNQTSVIYLDELEKKVAFEASEQRKIIQDIEKSLADFTTAERRVTNAVFHTERMFGSFLRIAAGILTAPFSGRNIFGTYLGVNLINKGVKDLRASLEPEYVTKTEVVHSYRSVEREILTSMDHVADTAKVIDDSLYQLDQFDDEFKEKFKEYSSLIPEYSNLEQQIAELKKKLSHKKREIKEMQEDLSKQYESNKIKVKKAA